MWPNLRLLAHIHSFISVSFEWFSILLLTTVQICGRSCTEYQQDVSHSDDCALEHGAFGFRPQLKIHKSIHVDLHNGQPLLCRLLACNIDTRPHKIACIVGCIELIWLCVFCPICEILKTQSERFYFNYCFFCSIRWIGEADSPSKSAVR
jgi:hypothetical protein